MRRCCFLNLIILLGAVILPAQEEPPKKLDSPDGTYSVRIIEEALPGADENIDFFTLILSKDGKEVAKMPTFGYLISAEWSPDGKHVAVNNRRGNAGDYVWVFALPSGKVLKSPDDNAGEAWEKAATTAIQKKFPSANDESLIRSWTTATGWKEGQLQFLVRGRYRGEENALHFEGVADPSNWKITSSKVSKTK